MYLEEAGNDEAEGMECTPRAREIIRVNDTVDRCDSVGLLEGVQVVSQVPISIWSVGFGYDGKRGRLERTQY